MDKYGEKLSPFAPNTAFYRGFCDTANIDEMG